MANDKLMTGVSGIRGIFGHSMTPDVAMKYAASFGILQNRGKIIVGRDSRTTGLAMFHAVVSGLISVGCSVVDLGIVSTPTVLLYVEENNADGGISITASHNPAEWNAMKFVDNNGMFLFPEKAELLLDFVNKSLEYSDWQNQGSIIKDFEASSNHIKKIKEISYIDIEKIKNKKFKVILDSVNGAGCEISENLLKEMGCEVIHINNRPTGYFAHTPEPLEKNLYQIIEEVKKSGADIGFATDPDVDRLAIVNEKGEFIGEEFSLLLAENYILSKVKGDIVTNLSSSMATDFIAKKYGVNVHRTKVGEINVGKKMLEINSPIGGEGNGGIICPEVHYTRDAPAGMAVILGMMADSNKKISELANEIPKYVFAKSKIDLFDLDFEQIRKEIVSLYPNEKQNNIDGIRISTDEWWIHVRKSGTEPIVRIYVESKSKELSEKICNNTINHLKNIIKES